MQTIVCLFLLFAVSAAEDGDITVYYDLESYKNNGSSTEFFKSPHPFEFGYRLNDALNIYVVLENKPESVTAAIQLIYPGGVNKKSMSTTLNEKENYISIHRHLKESKVTISLELNVNKKFCTKKNIVKAHTTRNSGDYYDICLHTEPCVVAVDLSNNVCSVPDKLTTTPRASTDVETSSKGDRNKERRNVETTSLNTSTDTNNKASKPSESSQSNVLVYVIPPVVVVCAVMFVVYMRVKKHYHRNPQPEGAIELNTYATANEVLYADLSLEQGNNAPPRRDEPPYAQIIGVMKPVPSGKLRNK